MAGCYGSDPEDRYWENRFINECENSVCTDCNEIECICFEEEEEDEDGE